MSLSARGQPAVEGDESLVPAEGRRQGGGKERAAQPAAAAGDVALAFMGSAVVVEGGKAGESGGLLAGDAAEFGHADDDRQRGALADAGNAADEIEAARQIVMGAQRRDDARQLVRAASSAASMSASDDAPSPADPRYARAGP